MYNPDEEYRYMIEKLKSICSERNISYVELAKNARVSKSYIYDLINEKARTSVYTLLLICNALDISLAELIKKDDVIWDVEKQNIIEIYQLMGESKRKMLNIYIDMLLRYEGNL